VPVDDVAAGFELGLDGIQKLNSPSLSAFARWLSRILVWNAAHVIFVDYQALVCLVPSFVAAAFFDDLVDGEVVQASVLR